MKRSTLISPIADSAASDWTAGCLITPASRRTAMANSGRAISCGICLRRWWSAALRKVWSVRKDLLSMPARSQRMPIGDAPWQEDRHVDQRDDPVVDEKRREFEPLFMGDVIGDDGARSFRSHRLRRIVRSGSPAPYRRFLGFSQRRRGRSRWLTAARSQGL